MSKWTWIWPYVGATPISEGLDSEMFDRTDYPYSDTFVREAIQNSLDARLGTSKAVTISFRFHEGIVGQRQAFLEDVISFRNRAGLSVPDAWKQHKVSWITIEDFNAKGLGGSLTDRMSDFWNYWLNFGVSNKDGSGRGGRGIGRVTFLIASQIRTVLGLTRRHSDSKIVASGMSILKALPDGSRLHSTHAYLAKAENASIYDLYDAPEFSSALRTAFEFEGYSDTKSETGLGLAIPYPHEELQPEGVLASAIEHFAPAILTGTLVVRVNNTTLDAGTIESVAHSVATSIRTDAIRSDVGRYINLIRAGLGDPKHSLTVEDFKNGLAQLKETPLVKTLQTSATQNEIIALQVNMPLERHGKKASVSLRAVICRTPGGQLPIDRLFREGMSLPDVKAKNPGEFDLIVLVDDSALATYLNFCEGKAHLDLLESKEIKSKLEEKGYSDGYRIRRFVKRLPVDLRNLLTPDITDPDSSVFDDFFAVDDDKPGNRPGIGRGVIDPPPPPPPPPTPKPPVLLIETLSDGFRAIANPSYTAWPVNISISMAYADGSRNPDWSEYDFSPSDLEYSGSGCDLSLNRNSLKALGCGPNTRIQVTGFDAQRELDTKIRIWKDAPPH
jgi:hypothetical protein